MKVSNFLPGYSGSDDSLNAFNNLISLITDLVEAYVYDSGPIKSKGLPSAGINTPAVSKDGQ